MTFRDYAQGAFRMRGIGRGQTLQLYVIPEVEELIRHELAVRACSTVLLTTDAIWASRDRHPGVAAR